MNEVMTQEIDRTDIHKEAIPVESKVRALSVKSIEGLQEASYLRQQVKGLQSFIEKKFAEPKKKSYAAWKAICGWEAEELAKPTELLKLIDSQAAAFKAEQDRKQKEELRAKELEAQKQAEADRKARAEHEKAMGNKQAAKEILKEEIVVPVVVVDEPEKVAGLSFRKDYFGEVKDLWVLVQAVAKDKELLPLLEANITGIRNFAKYHKNGKAVPGIIFGERDIPVGR